MRRVIPIVEGKLQTAEYARWILRPLIARLDKRTTDQLKAERCRLVLFWLDWGGLKLEEFNPSPRALQRLAAYQLTRK